MPNGIPAATADERLMQVFSQPIPDISHPSMAGAFGICLDGRMVTPADTQGNAIMQAETMHRYYAGVWSVVDRATAEIVHACGAGRPS